jgi:hypothetical protein
VIPTVDRKNGDFLEDFSVEKKRDCEMGFFSTIFGFCGFGLGISIGLAAGYFLFIYVQSSDVQVRS